MHPPSLTVNEGDIEEMVCLRSQDVDISGANIVVLAANSTATEGMYKLCMCICVSVGLLTENRKSYLGAG